MKEFTPQITMVENEYLSQNSNRKRIKQPVSVPFLWEEKPGTPKKDWKPSPVTPVNPIAPPPVKLVASVPFKWEEMPGKPLPCFPPAPQELPLLLLPPPMLLNSHSSTVYYQENDDKWDVASAIDDDDNDADDDYECDGDDEEDEMFESYLDAWGFETDDSFNPAPSLVANRLIPTAAISNAIPVQENFLMDSTSAQLQAPSSPTSDSDSSTSSYATGTTSLVGAPFLERLFPLLSPKSSFLEKVGCSQKNTLTPQMVIPSKDLDRESNCSLAVKRPLTLGELILMSRRRSYCRKAVLMRDQNLSLVILKVLNSLPWCFFGSYLSWLV